MLQSSRSALAPILLPFWSLLFSNVGKAWLTKFFSSSGESRYSSSRRKCMASMTLFCSGAIRYLSPKFQTFDNKTKYRRSGSSSPPKTSSPLYSQCYTMPKVSTSTSSSRTEFSCPSSHWLSKHALKAGERWKSRSWLMENFTGFELGPTTMSTNSWGVLWFVSQTQAFLFCKMELVRGAHVIGCGGPIERTRRLPPVGGWPSSLSLMDMLELICKWSDLVKRHTDHSYPLEEILWYS